MNQLKQLENDYLTPFSHEYPNPVKSSYVGFCTSKRCCKNKPEMLKMMVERRAQMATNCLDCGSVLFWTRK